MAARKKFRSEAESRPSIASRAADAVASFSSKVPDDPRPAAWKQILLAGATGQQVPRDYRVYADGRFTGPTRVAQVKALMYVGMEPEESVDAILKAAMEEHRGDKHCDW